MSVNLPSDSGVRAAAIDPSRSFLIQAPAGSGKTELLTDRILALLATVKRPEEIVAITFTRKAASEMHARVLAKLQMGLGEAPAEAHKQRSWQLAREAMRCDAEQGWNLLQYPARLSIRTIDSFCTYLVRAMPWLSSLGGLPSITDDAREHYEAAARATLEMVDESEPVARLVAHLDVDTRAAESLVADMLASRDQWLPLLGSGADAQQLLDHLNEALEEDLTRLASLMPSGWSEALAPSVSRAAANLAAGSETMDLNALQDWQGEPLGTSAHDLEQWQALAQVLLTSTNALRRTVTKKQGFEAKSDYKENFLRWLEGVDAQEPWLSALADVRQAPAHGYSPDQIEILRALIQVLWLASAQLTLRFTEKSEIDFIEISQRALLALGQADDPSDLLLKLDASIRHLLVDEFQDTSQSQIDLLERLTAGWNQGDGRTVFLVGDPMQSIYRFRKAEVGWFLKVQERGLTNVPLTALKLTNNFRSQANVVKWVNDVFEPLFPPQANSAMGAIPYTPSVAFNGGLAGDAVVFHPVWDTAGEESAEMEISSVAAESIAIRLAGEALARNPDSEHPVAILVRARSHLDNLVGRLAQEGIPCRAVELVSLKSRQVVSDLVQLARALLHHADRLAWLSVLRSPVCGLTLASLHTLFGSDHFQAAPMVLSAWLKLDAQGKTGLEPGEARRLRRVASILLDQGNRSGSVPFAAWLERCWQRLGGPAVYPGASDQADAERVFRLIEKLAPYGALDPADLDLHLDHLYAAPNSAGHAVEVMTIHKSKGLQFDTVILMGLHRRPRPEAQKLVRFEQSEGRLLLGPIRHRASDEPDPVSSYLAEREKKRASYETDRLLYVAVTRAREQLHLIGMLGLDDKKEGRTIKAPAAGSLLGRLWEHIQQPAAPSLVERTDPIPPLAPVAASRRLVRVGENDLPAVEPPRVAVQRGAAWQWQEESGDEAAIGTVAHAWLEHIGKEGLEQWPAQRVDDSVEIMRTQLGRAGVPRTALDAAADAVRQTLVATLASSRGQWLLRAARAYREWSLLDAAGRVSVIDLAISEEKGWLVVDYKTGIPWPDDTPDTFAARMRERHGAQIQRYCSQVSALDGRPARGALYFPRADIWVEC
ncbi:UvrD-helicase domain-containing protein [Paralcaligenes sp. KSB-10]|uniref:UvrD-helicase domain-containing protein n=1 Tax=Paralcaligenes sp. KSB-10 TaxID=2901142 RepID=UPI001E56292E|nr:UvrD-helicase domain-containing protein [Paralcaligenes sp. KSB-10]UHL65729.1 UvrD-helicase domain-containing protein [Paralcaligenes sp. KSB-10]